MIGTAREIMYCISLRVGWYKDLPVNNLKKCAWHRHIRDGVMSDMLCEKIAVTYFGVRKVRDAFIYPAFYKKKGAVLSEECVKMDISAKRKWYVGIYSPSYAKKWKERSSLECDINTLDEVFAHFGWVRVKDRIVCPALFELRQKIDDRYFPKVVLTNALIYNREKYKTGYFEDRVKEVVPNCRFANFIRKRTGEIYKAQPRKK